MSIYDRSRPLDLTDPEITQWMQQCGPCDYGLPYPCTCRPEGDYRPVVVRLVEEIERLRAQAQSQEPTA